MERVDSSKQNIETIKEYLRYFSCEVDPILKAYSDKKEVKSDELVEIYHLLTSLKQTMIKELDSIALHLHESDLLQDHHISVEKLSVREHEVLLLLAKGCSYQDVAEIIGCKQATTQTYVKRIYKKLQVHSKSEAVFEAISLGIIHLNN